MGDFRDDMVAIFSGRLLGAVNLLSADNFWRGGILSREHLYG
jgi:hypothetical protein